MRTLVTGGDGFVAAHLIPSLLRGGATVFGGTLGGDAPSGSRAKSWSEDVEWLDADVADIGSLRAAIARARPEQIVHLAAQSSVRKSMDAPLLTWDINATGTLRLMMALRALAPSATLLVVSSAEVDGNVSSANQPLAEYRPLAPRSPYGASKAAAEMAALHSATAAQRVIVARSFNPTGAGQDTSFALPGFARQLVSIKKGEAPPVLEVGNLEVRRDFLDVRDVVAAYQVLLARGQSGTVYNVCSGTAPPLRSLVERMIELSGAEARIQVEAARLRAADIPELRGDATRLRSLGWRQTHSTDEMLSALLQAAEN